jgi:aldehyde dehydrogenase (NAD+)
MVAVQTHRRAELAAEILATFGFTPGATLSGVAFGGRFADARGEVIETFDPTTGQRLAQISTPDASDYDAAVQEVIDVCDFAVGLSRQLYGRQMHSERPEHRLFEQWHPLGVVGIISAFNFPVAVPGGGWAIALACGDSIFWKPSELTPPISIAAQQLFHQVTNGTEAEGIFNLVVGTGPSTGEALIGDARIPLVQATGSCRMGEHVAAGGIAAQFLERLQRAYASVSIGDPLDESTLMGPLISRRALEGFQTGMDEIRRQGGQVVYGGGLFEASSFDGYFVEPTIVRSVSSMAICAEEIFAPILHVFEVDDLSEAIAVNNGVPQGLSSSLFTSNLQRAEDWLSATGSDCGIANVNVGTSGAEIGGAFGGEKATGGGRQAGSDAWKAYMRRQTCTVNYCASLPLAQGVRFDFDGSA